IIEEYANIDGIPLKIIDTAGIRDTDDAVEKIGVNKAKETVRNADLIIAVFDGSRDLTDEDHKIIDLIKDKQSLLIINKTDLPSRYSIEDFQDLVQVDNIINTSITEGIGIDVLEKSIKDMFYSGEIKGESDIVITNIRHKNQLEKSLTNINS